MKSKEKDFPQIVYQLHVENKKKTLIVQKPKQAAFELNSQN